MNLDKQIVDELNTLLADKSIADCLSYLNERFHGRVAFSTSFGYEDQCVTDIICTNNFNVRIFTLDTGRIFQETYKVFNGTRQRYNCKIEVYFPDAFDVEKLVTEKGPSSFYESIENRKECCNIRKVKPLARALRNTDIWITGLRAEQSEARQSLDKFQWDDGFGLIKFNPLHDWTLEQTKKYIREHNVPYNILHDRGFVSIGCAPCTRAIGDGEDFRAGRWWWEDNSKKECGLHER